MITGAPLPAYLDPEKLRFLDEVVALLSATDLDSWWAGPTYRSPCGTKHCCLAHIEAAWGIEAMERFESDWSSSYVIGAAVNDRASERYPQAHPKDRVLAYLQALRSGAEEDINTSMWRCCIESEGEATS